MTPTAARIARAALPLVVLLLASTDAAGAASAPALPPAPVVVRLSPPVWREGRAARIHLEPAPWLRPPLAAEIVDAYVLRRDLEAGYETTYLGPDGAWGDRPIPFRAGVAVRALVPFVVEWREKGLPGGVMVEVELVRPGTDPRPRDTRVTEPAAAATVVEARWPKPSQRIVFVGGLILFTLAALAWIVTRPGPPQSEPE
jgi:hypothetical protein